MIRPYPHLSISQPARYRILVQGWLGEGWDDWFEGMRLTPLELAEGFERIKTRQTIPGRDDTFGRLGSRPGRTARYASKTVFFRASTSKSGARFTR
jgi:hypothetical protein